MSGVQPGDRVSLQIEELTREGEVVGSPTSTHAAVAIDPVSAVSSKHRIMLWCEIASLVVLPAKGEKARG